MEALLPADVLGGDGMDSVVGAVKEGEGENVFLHLGSLCLHLSSPVSPVLTPAVPRTLVLDDAV